MVQRAFADTIAEFNDPEDGLVWAWRRERPET
jgi:hypothetical protein